MAAAVVCHVCGGPVTVYRRDLDQRPQHQDTIREYTMSCPERHVFVRQVILDPPPFPSGMDRGTHP
jgi:hypothetical protein